MMLLSRRAPATGSSLLLPLQHTVQLNPTSFMLGTSARFFAKSEASLFDERPEGISKQKWAALRKELNDRHFYRRKAMEASSRRERGIRAQLAGEMNRVQSIWDKIADINKLEGGEVSSNYIVQRESTDEKNPWRKYKFANMADYATWKEKNEEKYRKKL